MKSEIPAEPGRVSPDAAPSASAPAANAAAMRDALEKIGAMEVPHNFQAERPDIADACYALTRAIKLAKAALSAPPRNCDVGTAEEQGSRFAKFCLGKYCRNCPLFASSGKVKCELEFWQMPYEEGGAE